MRNCKYNLGEQRLLAVYLSRINPEDPNKIKEVIFTFKEFKKILGLNNDNIIYWQNVIDSLVTKTIKYYAWTTSVVFQKVTMYRDKDADELTIKLISADDMIPLFFDLKKIILNINFGTV